MGQRILIDPVTRIEGHSKITVYLDDAGRAAPVDGRGAPDTLGPTRAIEGAS